MTAIEIDHISKKYGRITVVDDLTFSARSGRITGFLGANGSGKTTTMRMLLGLTAASGGSATFGGRRYVDLPDPVCEVGAVITADAFHPGRTGRQHLRVLADAAGIPARRVEEMLALVGLSDAARRKVRGYSMGMRQRLSLAAAMLGDPGVLIFDEPLNGLDPEGIGWFRDTVRGFAAEGRTVLLSSHLLGEVASTVDDVVIIAAGRLVTTGALSDIMRAGRTVVRTPDGSALAAALHAAGYRAVLTNDGQVDVVGAVAAAVAQIAAQAGLLVTGLVEESDDLESIFRELTATQEVMS